ncbi:MAG TPA: alkane 1-monooxygenase [Saprospiraceae bacterium]|nr:alkane 1-monooxygenase [Saprospiraceae bacterium]HMQ82361.1 alkane 1-monooxygenase [Saprospiraceae bacterium]
MKAKDLKYLLAYVVPLSLLPGLFWQGVWSYFTIVFVFGLIPVLELVLPRSTDNLSASEVESRLKSRFFDLLLYLNIPVLYGAIAALLWIGATQELTWSEWGGLVLSTGIVAGACGINVAHELGHRAAQYEQLMAKILLLPVLYLHFFIEHNRGHHKHVATPEDPASAKRGQTLYVFWGHSLWGSYRSAWRLESKRLQQEGRPFWSIHNEMLRFQIAQLAYLVLVSLLGWYALLTVLGVALIAVLLLETINYIEHYGLRRELLPNGRYERVSPRHSWNADFELGRILLYELTRHSDHHYLASKKYPILDHHEVAPQLPVGYPAAMVLALLPPLWFRVMDKRLEMK